MVASCRPLVPEYHPPRESPCNLHLCCRSDSKTVFRRVNSPVHLHIRSVHEGMDPGFWSGRLRLQKGRSAGRGSTNHDSSFGFHMVKQANRTRESHWHGTRDGAWNQNQRTNTPILALRSQNSVATNCCHSAQHFAALAHHSVCLCVRYGGG